MFYWILLIDMSTYYTYYKFSWTSTILLVVWTNCGYSKEGKIQDLWKLNKMWFMNESTIPLPCVASNRQLYTLWMHLGATIPSESISTHCIYIYWKHLLSAILLQRKILYLPGISHLTKSDVSITCGFLQFGRKPFVQFIARVPTIALHHIRQKTTAPTWMIWRTQI